MMRDKRIRRGKNKLERISGDSANWRHEKPKNGKKEKKKKKMHVYEK